MDKVRKVAGEVLCKNGQTARPWRRSASMLMMVVASALNVPRDNVVEVGILGAKVEL